MKMSNAEDLNRLTACSLVLLGHIFYVLGNHRVRRISITVLFIIHVSARKKTSSLVLIKQMRLYFERTKKKKRASSSD